MKLKLEFQMDNAAFDPEWQDEAARILRELADTIQGSSSFTHKVRDVNGNVVGTVRVSY